MAAEGGIRIVGLREFQTAVQAMDADVDGRLDRVLEDAAEMVAAGARRKIPIRTGAARGSVKVVDGRITFGGRKAPYAGWLDFGGRVGPKRSVLRPYKRQGRYLYKTLGGERSEIDEIHNEALVDLARGAGLEVTRG